MFGLSFEGMIAWIIAGLPFDALSAIGNFGFGILIVPLSELLLKLEKKKYQLAYDCLSFIQPPPKDKEKQIITTAIYVILEEDGQDEATEFVNYISSKRSDVLKIIEECI